MIHHLSKLIATGLVVIEEDKYVLRAKNLEQTLKKMKLDVLSAYEEMEDMAKEIDTKLQI